MLWPLHGSAGLHLGHGSCFSYTPFSGYPYASIPRRLAGPVFLSGVSPRGSSDCPPTLSRVGDRHQSQQVQPRTFPGSTVSRGRHRLHLFQGFSVGGTHLTIFPRPQFLCPGRLGRSLFMLRAKRSYCRVLRFRSPAPILHRFRIRRRSSCGYHLLVHSRLRGVFVARAVVPRLAFRFAGIVFAFPSFPIAVTVFVCPLCVTTRQLWLPSPCRTGLCPVFLCLLPVTFFGVVRVSRPPPPSDSLPGQFLCSGGFLLDRRDPIMGSEWLFFRHRWMPLSCALRFSCCLIVHDGSSQVASPFLFPRPESQGGLLDCVSHSLSRPGALRFPSFLSSVGGWVESGRLFSLELWAQNH